MEKDFHKEFGKCPCCGSENRFLEQLGNELKARGLAREDWQFHMDVKQGHVVDPTKEAAIPIGSEIPAYGFITDICMECGCIYAINLSRGDVKKSIAPAPPMPNRAERRRDAREQGPGIFNPFSGN